MIINRLTWLLFTVLQPPPKCRLNVHTYRIHSRQTLTLVWRKKKACFSETILSQCKVVSKHILILNCPYLWSKNIAYKYLDNNQSQDYKIFTKLHTIQEHWIFRLNSTLIATTPCFLLGNSHVYIWVFCHSNGENYESWELQIRHKIT